MIEGDHQGAFLVPQFLHGRPATSLGTGCRSLSHLHGGEFLGLWNQQTHSSPNNTFGEHTGIFDSLIGGRYGFWTQVFSKGCRAVETSELTGISVMLTWRIAFQVG